MEIINLTPHTVTVYDEEGKKKAFYQPEDVPARVKASVTKVYKVRGIPLTKTTFGEVENLPAHAGMYHYDQGILFDYQDENLDQLSRSLYAESGPLKYYIVSRLVKSACPDRNDLLCPNELVRDGDGNIIGCKSFEV